MKGLLALGVIGGADGPTAVFVTGGETLFVAAIAGGVLLLAGLTIWLVRKFTGKK